MDKAQFQVRLTNAKEKLDANLIRVMDYRVYPLDHPLKRDGGAVLHIELKDGTKETVSEGLAVNE